LNGIAWNLVNLAIVVWLMWRIRPGRRADSALQPDRRGAVA